MRWHSQLGCLGSDAFIGCKVKQIEYSFLKLSLPGYFLQFHMLKVVQRLSIWTPVNRYWSRPTYVKKKVELIFYFSISLFLSLIDL